MTLITLLIVLSIERIAATGSVWQFEFYYQKMKSLLLTHFDTPQWLQGKLGLWLWILLPVVIVQAVANALEWQFLEFVFNTLVLLICIGCIQKRKLYKSFLNAANRKDQVASQHYADQLMGVVELQQPTANQAEESHSTDQGTELAAELVTESAIISENASAETLAVSDDIQPTDESSSDEQTKHTQSIACQSLGLTLVWFNFRYYCAVLFWFVCLGPAGAVLYCIVRESADDSDEKIRSMYSKSQLDKLLHVLDWLPARVCSAGYLLIGNFSKSAGIWLSYLLDLNSSAKALVGEIASAAEAVDPVSECKITEPACMLRLAKRNILFFLALVALLTLYGGIR